MDEKVPVSHRALSLQEKQRSGQSKQTILPLILVIHKLEFVPSEFYSRDIIDSFGFKCIKLV